MASASIASIGYAGLLAFAGLLGTGCVNYAGFHGNHEIQGDSSSQIWLSEVSQVKVRNAQSRVFDTTDRVLMMQAIVGTLQDLGFQLEVLDEKLGIVSAKKFLSEERPSGAGLVSYLMYDEVTWSMPLGTKGDNFDRFRIRVDEIEQSRKIIDQCLARMPEGPVSIDDWSVVLPPKDMVYNSIEAMMAHFKLIMEGIKVPPGEVYSYSEGANGELGFFIVADGSGKPYKLHVRPPCLHPVATMREVLVGSMLADIIPTFDTFNMIGGEIDR